MKDQKKFFHSGILIENNEFETFDRPLLYAKSTDGLIFINNTVIYNTEFEQFHWNKYMFFFEKVKNIQLLNNQFEKGIDPEKDIRTELSEPNSVILQK